MSINNAVPALAVHQAWDMFVRPNTANPAEVMLLVPQLGVIYTLSSQAAANEPRVEDASQPELLSPLMPDGQTARPAGRVVPLRLPGSFSDLPLPPPIG